MIEKNCVTVNAKSKTMIKEAFVSFEVARLLKEKGFCEKTIPFYEGNGKFCSRIGNVCQPHDWNNDRFVFFSAPTHQMAMGWLREEKGVDCFIEVSDITARPRKYYTIIWDIDNKSYIIDLFETFEEAVEAALKYSLENLI